MYGYVAAAAEGSTCLSAVLYRPGNGQQIKLPIQGEFGSRIAAACVSLGGGRGSTVGQKEHVSHAVRVTLEEMRALGRGSCLIGGDPDAGRQKLSIAQELRRARWPNWGSEPTCITAGTRRPRRIDQAWVSPDM